MRRHARALPPACERRLAASALPAPQPPDFAARGDRRDTFSAALEQSEQFFRAGDSVGYESKPVMLYYWLSEAF